MNRVNKKKYRALLTIAIMFVLTASARLMRAETGACPAGSGNSVTLPFTDVSAANGFFCSIASAFFSGLANGTSATTFSPADNVNREQMAAFISRTLDQSLQRGSTRAALQRFWQPHEIGLGFRCPGGSFRLTASNGAHVWVANPADDEVIRFNTTHGQQLATWTNATQAFGVLALDEHIYVTGRTVPGRLFRINTDSQTGGVAVELTDNLGGNPEGMTSDETTLSSLALLGGSISLPLR